MKKQGFAVAVLLVATAAGQSPAGCQGCTPGSGVVTTGKWRVPIRTVQLKADVLAVNLKQVRGVSWRLAVSVKEGDPKVAKLQVAELEMSEPAAGRPPLPVAIRSY